MRSFVPIPVFVLGALHIFALFLLGPGMNTDAEFTTVHLAGTVLIFAVWLFGVLGYGRWLSIRLVSPPFHSLATLALAVVIATWIPLLLGHLSLIGPQSRWIFAAFSYAGIGLGLKQPLRWPKSPPLFVGPKIKQNFHRRIEWMVTLALIFVVGLRCLKALLPWSQSDPLIYNLYGPRLWLNFRAFMVAARLSRRNLTLRAEGVGA